MPADDLAEVLAEPSDQATLIIPLTSARLAAEADQRPAAVQDWISRCGFQAAEHQLLHLPGDPPRVLYGLGDGFRRRALAEAPAQLPPGDYRLDPTLAPDLAGQAVLDWLSGGYRYDRLRSAARRPRPRLCWPAGLDRASVLREARATSLVRDLVNAPANAMGPAELEAAVAELALNLGASLDVVSGEALERGYPLIHAVGRASPRAPRLLDLRWGDSQARKLTLIGKGVCFDTGGLDIKSADSMRLMKKDMAGAAHALALAGMVIQARLPVRLRLLIPAVENAVGGAAMRPSDVIASRKGLTVEIGHTDAEGRLILADALAAASEEAPELILDFATLTGAARVALGADLPALFTNSDALARDLEAAAAATEDPLWRMPLWRPYAAHLAGGISDLVSILPTTHAGAVYAALFLESFVDPGVTWAHLDLFGWNLSRKAGRPEGAEPQTLRAVFHMLRGRFAGG